MALTNIREIDRAGLVQRSAQNGKVLLSLLKKIRSRKLQMFPRGLGLMAGVELKAKSGAPATAAALAAVKNLLHRGFIFLPEGEHSNVISLTPPLTISEVQLRASVTALQQELE
jgi:4-aminobutyrate aminotransferase-like enzyme